MHTISPSSRPIPRSAVFLVSFAILLSRSLVAQQHDWQIEFVDSPKKIDNLGDRWFQADSLGNLHAVYGGSRLCYARHDGQAWHYEVADAEIGSGKYASLALDVQGYPYVAHCAYHSVKYAHRDASGWHVEVVRANADLPRFASIALDAVGVAHVCWADGGTVEYARRNPSGWQHETIDEADGSAIGPSIATRGDHVYVSYATGSPSSDVRCALRDAEGWSVTTIDSSISPYLNCRTSLCLDNSGYPHVAYSTGHSHGLTYAHQDVSGWTTEEPNLSGQLGYGVSMLLDASGKPQIAAHYRSYSEWKLQYLWKDVSGWHWRTVVQGAGDEAEYVGAYPTLSVVPSGQVWVGCGTFQSYYEDLLLQCAPLEPFGWQPMTIDRGGHVGTSNCIDLDGQGQPHIAYFDQLGHVLRYTWFDGSTWQFEMVDSASGEVSLATDYLDRPHMVYCVTGGLRYAYRDGGLWVVIPVSTGAGPELGWHPSLAVDEQCDPHVSFTGLAGSRLKYAHLSEGIWTVEVVDPFDDWSECGTRTAIALDSRGAPHIAYGVVGYRWWSVRYAARGPLGWTTGGLSGMSSYPSIAIDTDGFAHVACGLGRPDQWGDYHPYYLRYLHNAQEGWVVETVDTEAEGPTSVALDPGDSPHITYHGMGSPGGMRYASRGGTWKPCTTRRLSAGPRPSPSTPTVIPISASIMKHTEHSCTPRHRHFILHHQSLILRTSCGLM